VTPPTAVLPSVCHLPVIRASKTRETVAGPAPVAYRECVATARYRTLLEQLVRQGRWTIEETCVAFEKTAREMRESATLSPRQLARWMRGDVGQARPVAQRVAEEFWGHSFEALLGSPQVMSDHELRGGAAASGPSVDVESLEAAALMAAHESFEHAARTAGEVDPGDISRLHESVWQLARRYHSTPPLQLLAEGRHIRNLSYLLLERTRRPAQTAELYLTAGQACGLLSVASFDLALWDAAEEQARSAHTYADLVGHDDLRAWSRGTQAVIANWRGQPRRAVDLIGGALSEAPSGIATARLRAIEARAWAELGQPDRVRDSLRLADDELSGGWRDDDLYGGTGGEFGWGPSRHAACAGTALLNVGHADSAASRIREAITALPEDPLGGLVPARAQIDLAAAELMAGRLDASSAALDEVWALPAPHRRQGLTGRLDQLARHLTSRDWRDAREAGELRDRIEVFNAEATSRKALPSA
jgi:hypothetical protein